MSLWPSICCFYYRFYLISCLISRTNNCFVFLLNTRNQSFRSILSSKVPILSSLWFLCSNSNNLLIISLNSINSFLNLFLNPNSCLYTDTSISLIILRSYLIFAWSNLFLFHSLSNNFLIFLTKFQRPPILFSRKSLILLSYLLFNMSLCCNPR